MDAIVGAVLDMFVHHGLPWMGKKALKMGRRIKLCLLLLLHFSKTMALLFMIFLCVIRYNVRPSFGYDRQIVLDNILILSGGRRRNYVKHKRQSEGLGLRHTMKCCQLQMKSYSR